MVVVECEQDMKGDIIELKSERVRERDRERKRERERERESMVGVRVRD